MLYLFAGDIEDEATAAVAWAYVHFHG